MFHPIVIKVNDFESKQWQLVSDTNVHSYWHSHSHLHWDSICTCRCDFVIHEWHQQYVNRVCGYENQFACSFAFMPCLCIHLLVPLTPVRVILKRENVYVSLWAISTKRLSKQPREKKPTIPAYETVHSGCTVQCAPIITRHINTHRQ